MTFNPLESWYHIDPFSIRIPPSDIHSGVSYIDEGDAVDMLREILTSAFNPLRMLHSFHPMLKPAPVSPRQVVYWFTLGFGSGVIALSLLLLAVHIW